MSAAPMFIDVNVPMYAAGKAHPYQEACAWVLNEVAEGNLPGAIDVEIVQEILHRYGALQRWQLAETMATSMLELVPTVLPITADDMETTVELFGRYAEMGVTARDLIHAAVMRHHSLTQIISTDAHFDQIEGIVRLDPLTLFEHWRQQRATE